MPEIIQTYVTVKTDNGKLSKMTEAKFNNLAEDAEKEGAEAPVAVSKQTYKKHYAETLEEAQALVPDLKVLVTYFNRGYGLAEEKFISDQITDSDFTASDEIIDLTSFVATLPERTRKPKVQSVEDIISAISALTPDKLAEVLKTLGVTA